VTAKFVEHPNPTCFSALRSKCGLVEGKGAICEACLFVRAKSLPNSTCDFPDYFHFCGAKSPFDTCEAGGPEWGCWAVNVPRKTAGFWYSTLEEGMCTESSADGTCGWKVISTKTIKEECLKDKITSAVEKKTPDCFQECGPRNTTSPCWISCFFGAVLGPEAGSNASRPLGGIPTAQLEQYWNDAFLPEEHGGCPQVDISRFSQAPSLSTVVV